MNVSQKLIISFSILLVCVVSTTSYYLYNMYESSIIDNKIHDMKDEIVEKTSEINSLHNSAKDELYLVMQNPLFVEYFNLPDTKAGNIYKNGVLQFTDKQRELKTKLEQLIYNFQNKFQVDETCLVDLSGEEHVRLVLHKIAPDSQLSGKETQTPFFIPTFEKSKDDVNVQYPYLSPDTNRWVFAYSSPIVLGDGKKPAFFHFEIPMNVFESFVHAKNARVYVLDSSGYIIADSQHQISSNTSPDLTKHFPSINTISVSSEFNKLIQQMKNEKAGFGTYDISGETHYVVYERMAAFDWTLVYDKPYSALLGQTNLLDLRMELTIIATLSGIAAIASSIFITRIISKRINIVKKGMNEISISKLGMKIIDHKNDEFSDLVNNFNSMSDKLYVKNLQLTEAEEQYRYLYDNDPDLLGTISTEGILLNCNKTYAAVLGSTKEELIGKPVFDYVADRSIEDAMTSFSSFLANGKIRDNEIWIKRRDGSIFPSLISANGRFDENGKLI